MKVRPGGRTATRLLDSFAALEYASAMSEVKPVVFRAVRCTLEVIRPRQGVVLLRFTGPDVGEFGEAPFRELANDLQRAPSIQLFVDAGNCSGASIDVSSDWARWMSSNRAGISALHILCGSRFIQLTADFVRRFTGFEERMRIYTERVPFEMALRERLA